MEVIQKISEMQKYIPCLKSLIENLEKNQAKQEQVKKMQYLLDMLTKKDSSIKLETLVRCEDILMKIYAKEPHLESPTQLSEQIKSSNKNASVNGGEGNAEKLIPDCSDDSHDKITNGNSPSTEEANVNGNCSKVIENAGSQNDAVNIPTENNKSNETTPKYDSDVEYVEGLNGDVHDGKLDENTETRKNDDRPANENKKDVSNKSPSPQLKDQDHKVVPETTTKENQLEEKDDSIEIVDKKSNLESAKKMTKKSNDDVDSSESELNFDKSNEKEGRKLSDLSLHSDNKIQHVEKIEKPPDEIETAKEIEDKSKQGDHNSEECDMDIDEDLTPSKAPTEAVTGTLLKESVPNDAGQEKAVEPVKTERPMEKPMVKSQSPNASVVDLTSDDSNDGLPPQKSQSTPGCSPNKLHVEKIQLEAEKPSDKPAVVYLIKNTDESGSTISDSSTLKDLLQTNNPLSKITTIDLLDSDSDDGAQVKPASSNSKKNPDDRNKQLKMPTPKIDKPMFTIASVKSINVLQAQQDQRREVEKTLYAIVKTEQYTSHHTVPQKHNTAVRNYLENFIKDLMHERNRVNMCLQKLQRILDVEKYRQVKKIIQTFCSEPVNDPCMPAPSPYCHRIKVYPEKLQFVMRQLSFFNNWISVIGYKMYGLHVQIRKSNGLVQTHVLSPDTRTPPQRGSGIGQSPQNTASLARPLQATSSRIAGVPGRFSGVSARNPGVSGSLPYIPVSSQHTSKSLLIVPCGGDDLLAPMKSQVVSPSQKQKRRKRSSNGEEDDDDDENYVPQGFFSESDEGSDSNSRRASLQRASKLRCQKYLELERTINDEAFIQAAEANMATTSKVDRPKKTSQPSAKKAKTAPRAKKQKYIEQKEEMEDSYQDDGSDDDEEMVPTKRPRKSDDDQDWELDEEEDEDYETPPPIDLSKENMGKNIIPAYHCRSKFIDRCLICHDKLNVKCAVSHYVNSHRDREVFIARLRKSDMMKLQSETMSFAFLLASRGIVNTYVAYCVLCEREQCMSAKNWWEHYSRHTGEYLYECVSCKARRSCRQQINRHVNIECSVKGSGISILHEVDPDLTRIDAYVCLLCNYIQLRSESVLKHLHTEHELSANISEIPETAYQMVNLFKIETNYYETSEYHSGGGVSATEQVDVGEFQYVDEPVQDDVSFMICNMLASTGHEQPANEMENSMDTRSQSPEMIIPEFVIPKKGIENVTTTAKTEDAVSAQNSNLTKSTTPDASQQLKSCVPSVVEPETSKIEISREQSESDEQKPADPQNACAEQTDKILGETLSTHNRATDTKKAELQQNDTTENDLSKPTTLEKDSASQLNDDDCSIENDEAARPDERVITVTSSPLKCEVPVVELDSNDTSQTSDSIQTSEIADDLSAKANELSKEHQSGDNKQNKSRLLELSSMECLTKSATETIFQRVSDSIIDFMLKSSTDTTNVLFGSTPEQPESGNVSHETTSELPDSTSDSVESGPQFLKPSSEIPSDHVLLAVSQMDETIVVDNAVELDREDSVIEVENFVITSVVDSESEDIQSSVVEETEQVVGEQLEGGGIHTPGKDVENQIAFGSGEQISIESTNAPDNLQVSEESEHTESCPIDSNKCNEKTNEMAVANAEMKDVDLGSC